MDHKRRKLILVRSFDNWKQHMEFSGEITPPALLSPSLSANLATLQERFHQSPDLTIRIFRISGLCEPNAAALLFIDGLTNKMQIEANILTPLMVESAKLGLPLPATVPNLLETLASRLTTVGNAKYQSTLDELCTALTTGSTVLLLDGQTQALSFSTPQWERRSISEPENEMTLRGAKQGFVETLQSNIAFLRRLIQHADLTFEMMPIGQRSQTKVCLAYLQTITAPELLQELKQRLGKINTDAILGAGYIEQFIEDAPLSPFPTVGYTERPDVAAAKILEGRVAILIDNSPFCLTVPSLFIEGFQSPDDYNFRPFYQTVIRMMRYIGFSLSLLSPALYVALTTFHPELIPTPLLVTMMAATHGAPFPAFVEALGMGIVFELLREAGIRLPRPIGQTISFVGALIIGQSAVTAGLVSAPVVIVVAITAIASLIAPAQSSSSFFIRFGLTILAGLLGAFGILVGLLWTVVHLTSLRSFGVPYLAPLAPTVYSDLKDVIIRVPLWAMFNRPRSLPLRELQRQGTDQKPQPMASQSPNNNSGNQK